MVVDLQTTCSRPIAFVMYRPFVGRIMKMKYRLLVVSTVDSLLVGKSCLRNITIVLVPIVAGELEEVAWNASGIGGTSSPTCKLISSTSN